LTTTCDTSVLVPALASWHSHHDDALRTLVGRVDVLVGHALLEAYSVLNRLPAPHRSTPQVAGASVGELTQKVVQLTDPRSLIARMASGGLGGGSVYDALIGATAAEHDCLLLTRDHRARATYDVIGARYEVL